MPKKKKKKVFSKKNISVFPPQKVPYRAMYPNATEREWKIPKRETERVVNVLQLRDPNVEPALFKDKCESNAELGDDEEEDGGKYWIEPVVIEQIE